MNYLASSELEQHTMWDDLTEAGFLFVSGAVVGMLVMPAWVETLVVFGGQAVITFGFWLARIGVRAWLRRRALPEAQPEEENR